MLGLDSVDRLAAAVVSRISVAESSTSFTGSVVELASGLGLGATFSFSASVPRTTLLAVVVEGAAEGRTVVDGVVVTASDFSGNSGVSLELPDSVTGSWIEEVVSEVAGNLGVVLLNL